jgi:hypothetical protein
MAPTRSLAILGAALAVGLTLNSVPAKAQSFFSSMFSREPAPPLQATPPPKSTKKIQHTTRRAPQRPATRRLAQPSLAAAPPPRQTVRPFPPPPFGIALLELLPWSKTTELQDIRYLSRASESQVLSAADAFVGHAPDAIDHGKDAADPVHGLARFSPDHADDDGDRSEIALVDEHEFNEIDLAAAALEQPTGAVPWLHALLAMLGGALAAISTVRKVFA